jgi:hypothetical protein
MSAKPVVHLVYACTMYEGDSVVAVYGTAASAEAFVAKCTAYNARKPAPPRGPIEDTPESNAAFDKWWSAHEKWVKRHPASPHWSQDSYRIEKIEVKS